MDSVVSSNPQIVAHFPFRVASVVNASKEPWAYDVKILVKGHRVRCQPGMHQPHRLQQVTCSRNNGQRIQTQHIIAIAQK
jgi:hypothetical protein